MSRVNPWVAPALLNCHPTGRFQAISPFLHIKGHNVRERENDRNGEGKDGGRLCPRFIRPCDLLQPCVFFRVINPNLVINQQFGESRGSARVDIA